MTRGKKERLGRGLSALLGEYLEEGTPAEAGDVRQLPVSRIRPNPFQPRKEFQPEELNELADSIRQNGLLQPLMVRPAPSGPDGWELVAITAINYKTAATDHIGMVFKRRKA